MKDGIPRLRMFAGPNGSGKSTIKSYLKPHWFGTYLNADDLEREMREQRRLDIAKLAPGLEARDLLERIRASGQARHDSVARVLDSAKADNLVLHLDGHEPDSYFASALVEAIREHLTASKVSHTFETVMSHPSKVEALQRAQQAGFRTYLYFVATRSSEINVARVAARYRQGGHPVPEEKIRERYQRSLELLAAAVKASNRAFLFDNSGERAELLMEVTNEHRREFRFDPGSITHWILDYCLVPLLKN